MPSAVRLLALALLLVACGSPRAPNAAPGEEAADGGELSCDERARARVVCLEAMRDRCRTRQTDCEAECGEQRQMPANTMKHPSEREDLDTPRCRDACRVSQESCLRSTQSGCPVPCQ